MKKALSMVIAIALACSAFAACDSKDEEKKSKKKEDSSASEPEKVYEDITVQTLVIPKEAKAEEAYFGTNYYKYTINEEYDVTVSVTEVPEYDSAVWGSDEQKYRAAESYLLNLSTDDIDDPSVVFDYDSDVYKKLSIEEDLEENGFRSYRFEYDGNEESVAYYATKEYNGYRYVFALNTDTVFDYVAGKEVLKKADNYHDKFIEFLGMITHT